MTMPQVLSVSLVAAAAIQSLEVDCALALGDKGLDVQALQLILKELRIYNGVLDGEFDFKTERGLLFLQNYLNVCLTGQLDIETWYALTYWAEESASHQANKLAATC